MAGDPPPAPRNTYVLGLNPQRGGTARHQAYLIPSLLQFGVVLQLLKLTLVSPCADLTKPRISAKPVFTWFHPHLRLLFDLNPTGSPSGKGCGLEAPSTRVDRPILFWSRGDGSFSELFPSVTIFVLIYLQTSVALRRVNDARLGRTCQRRQQLFAVDSSSLCWRKWVKQKLIIAVELLDLTCLGVRLSDNIMPLMICMGHEEDKLSPCKYIVQLNISTPLQSGCCGIWDLGLLV